MYFSRNFPIIFPRVLLSIRLDILITSPLPARAYRGPSVIINTKLSSCHQNAYCEGYGLRLTCFSSKKYYLLTILKTKVISLVE